MLVAISLTALIALAALAIDVTTLYVAHSEAEKAADAAALAGAKAFVSTGFTSGGLGDWTSPTPQSLACNGSSGFADLQAQAAANRNTIAGAAPTSVTTACNFTNPENPQITVTVVRTGLPSFFGRIWRRAAPQVTAVSKAEAFNPSGGTTNVAVANVKPWLVANCDSTHAAPANTNCPGSAYFVNPATGYGIANNGSFIGQPLRLQQLVPGLVIAPLLNTYYALNLPVDSASVSCPAASSVSCASVTPGSPGFFETVACANSKPLKCGDSVSVNVLGGILPPSSTQPALCLTHASGYTLGQGQDLFVGTNPVKISGGANNPDATMRTATNLSRSDSVVTVPIWDGAFVCISGVTCTPTVVGFLQLGIQQVEPPLVTNGAIDTVILNVVGCGNAGSTTISGSWDPTQEGGVSPIPVRLVR